MSKTGAGQKLPSEAELAITYGVSRTVVREAVTALKATGHVVSRRGLGTYVETNIQPTFRITREELLSLENVTHVLELRYAIESEAAALAALNRSERSLETILKAIEIIDQDMANDRMAVNADLQFHLAIASASGNPYFRRLLESLGTRAIPRKRVHADLTEPSRRQVYLVKIQSEHRAIYHAIATENPTSAAARSSVASNCGTNYPASAWDHLPRNTGNISAFGSTSFPVQPLPSRSPRGPVRRAQPAVPFPSYPESAADG